LGSEMIVTSRSYIGYGYGATVFRLEWKTLGGFNQEE
jgi:hypothetical protein